MKEGEFPGALFGLSDQNGIRRLGCFIHKENWICISSIINSFYLLFKLKLWILGLTIFSYYYNYLQWRCKALNC